MHHDFVPDTAAELLLFLLGAHGVEHLFLNTGTDSAPLQEAALTLPRQGITIPKIHTSTFESVSLAAAHGFFQATGKPQCVFVHVDSGTQNLGAMVHNAFRDKAGVIILAGKTPYGESLDARGGRSGFIHWLQDMPDQMGIVRSYAKLATEITREETMDRAIGRAVQIATSYPAGPVYLTIARDVLMDKPAAEASRTEGFAVPHPPAMSESDIAWLANAIVDAERPVLITSRAGRRKEGLEAVVQLAELTGMIVIRGADGGPVSIPTLHPLHRRAPRETAVAIRESDLVIIVETEVPYIPRAISPSESAQVIHIDPDPLKFTMPLWSFAVDQAICADGPVALGQLVKAIGSLSQSHPDVKIRLAERVKANSNVEVLDYVASEEALAISPHDVFAALNDTIAESDIVIDEAVTNSTVLYQNLVRSEANTIAGAFAPGLGWSLGGAIGLKLAHPAERVIAVCGDGAFLFGVPSSALQMAANIGTPFVVVILNNNGYRASRLPVYELFPGGASVEAGNAVGTRFETPDFVDLARACHAYGARVERRSDLVDALNLAFHEVDDGRCAVIDVRIVQN